MKSPFEYFLPQETIDNLSELGRGIDQRAWKLGDDALAIYATLQKVKAQIIAQPGKHYSIKVENRILIQTFGDVLVFVADASGLSTATVRRYANLARFYPPEMRESFSILPMSHFEWGMGFPEYVDEILELDVRLADGNDGKPLPLRILQALFRSIDRIPETLDQLSQVEEIEEVLALVDAPMPSPPNSMSNEIPTLVFHFLRNMGRIADYIERAVDRWSISPEEKEGIVELVRQLSVKIKEAQERREIDETEQVC